MQCYGSKGLIQVTVEDVNMRQVSSSILRAEKKSSAKRSDYSISFFCRLKQMCHSNHSEQIFSHYFHISSRNASGISRQLHILERDAKFAGIQSTFGINLMAMMNSLNLPLHK